MDDKPINYQFCLINYSLRHAQIFALSLQSAIFSKKGQRFLLDFFSSKEVNTTL